MNQDHLLLKPSSSDRSASLDGSDNLASLPVSSPALSTAKGGLNKLPIPSSRQTPFKNLTNQDSLRSILSRQNFSIRSPSLFQTAESATKPIFLNDLKYFTEANTSRKRHERTKSDHPNKENYERSFGLTVQEAYDLQFEKENEFMKEKVSLEKGIIAETNLLQQVIKAIEVDVNNKEKTLVALDETMAQLEKIEMKSLERDDPIWFDLPLSLTDFEQTFKGLTTATRSLRETLQKMANEASEHKEKVSIQETERELGVLTEKISILVHKLTEIEDKKMQMKECEQMVEEDIYSYEVALAESTFIHEEASAVIDALKLKDSDAFENAKKEIVLDRRFFELEVELQQKEEAIQKELQILTWNEREADNLLREIKEGSREISIAIEKEKVLDREMFDPKNNLFSKMQTAMRSISPQVNWGELLNFFKIFELGLEMEPYDKNRVIMYQNDLLEEILYVIRQTQAIESLESMTIPKPRVSVTNRGERRYSKVLESISSNKEVQNEIVNKKLDLNEKLAIFNEKKSKSMEMIENNIRRKYDFIRYCETSFYDIMKKIDPKLKKVTEDTIIEIVSRAEATWKAYMSLTKEINERQTELQSLEEDLECIRKTIKDYEASIDSYKKEGELKRKEIDMVLGQLNLLQEKHLAIEMREKDEDLLSITSEKLLEREQVQTRRGDALVKLKKDFGAIENKIRDWRKMKKDIIESEDLINNLESYMTKIEQNVENDLKISLKKSKGQVAEFKLKAAIVQRDLLEVLEQEEEIIKKFEHMVYSKIEENRERTISVFVDSIECRGFLSELIKEIRGKILKGFVENLLQGVELSCIETSEIQKINEQVEQIEAEQYKNQGLNYTTILQNELKKIQNSIQEKKSQLISGEKEAEKYRHFYEVSNELLKSRTPSVAQSPAMSILSPSLRSPLEISKIKPISPIPSQTSLLKNVLDSSSKISTKRDSHTGVTQSKHRKTNSSIQHCFKHESERRPAFMTPMTPITPIASTDLQLDSHWLKETEPISLESLSGKSQSTSGNGQSTHTKSNDSDKQLNVEYGRPTEGRLSCVARMEKIPKLLEVSEDELHMLISQFEAGFVVYKRFSESNKVEERVTVCLSIKGKTKPKTDLIGYGKRIFRLNIKEKTIEVIKTGPGSRNTVECKYDWSSLKKVLLPQKTLEALKERHLQSPRKVDDVKEEAFGLKLSMDVVNKGRIDLLMWNIWHVITLWNIVNKALTPGNMFSTVKK